MERIQEMKKNERSNEKDKSEDDNMYNFDKRI